MTVRVTRAATGHGAVESADHDRIGDRHAVSIDYIDIHPLSAVQRQVDAADLLAITEVELDRVGRKVAFGRGPDRLWSRAHAVECESPFGIRFGVQGTAHLAVLRRQTH